MVAYNGTLDRVDGIEGIVKGTTASAACEMLENLINKMELWWGIVMTIGEKDNSNKQNYTISWITVEVQKHARDVISS